MYLVAECIATSTPGISSERWWKGVAWRSKGSRIDDFAGGSR